MPASAILFFIFYFLFSPVRAQDSLKTYIQAALRENPEVRARWHAYEAAVEAVCPAGTLGDPELSVNFYPKPMTQVNGK